MSPDPVTDKAAADENTVKIEPAGDFPASSTSTPPSSLPTAAVLDKRDTAVDQSMPPPALPASACPPSAGRKRSRESAGSSQTVVPNASDQLAQDKGAQAGINSTNTIRPDTQIKRQSPPPSTVTHTPATPPSAQVPPAMQKLSRADNSSRRRPGPTSRQIITSAAEPQHDSDSSSASAQNEPQDHIDDFDWEDLMARYESRIGQLNNEEQKLVEEFDSLMSFFSIWTDVGSAKEVDRSFKRLKTQASYVQHEESQLEHRRKHYIAVVNAFRSALELLSR